MAYHPYSDPIGSGLVQLTPSQRLMNADAYRNRQGPGTMGDAGDSGSPLGDLGDQLGSVLYSAGYGRAQKPVASDADEPTQGVHSDGNDLYHVRDNRDGTASVSHLGPDDFSSQQEGA